MILDQYLPKVQYNEPETVQHLLDEAWLVVLDPLFVFDVFVCFCKHGGEVEDIVGENRAQRVEQDF